MSAHDVGQVAGDRREVERRDREDEALERPELERVEHARAARCGCSARRDANATLKRRKSMSSHAASISAWYAVLLWPSIVAALSVCRHGPASRSAARRKTRARSSKGVAAQRRRRGERGRDRALASPRRRRRGRSRAAASWSCGALTSSTSPSRNSLPPTTCGNVGPLVRHRRERGLERGALGGARRVGEDGLVRRERARRGQVEHDGIKPRRGPLRKGLRVRRARRGRKACRATMASPAGRTARSARG